MKTKVRIYSLLPTCILLIAGGVCSIDLPQKPNNPLKWWQEEVVYQIYPRSHKDTDNDGTGDLKGITETLDHFVDLGVGSVWISPIYKSPMKDFGYDISDFLAIEPTFGTMEDFEDMKVEMNDRNIKLIMDFVPNHSSDQHEWFEKSVARVDPYTDYYVWREPKGRNPDGTPIPPNNWLSVFGGSAWEYNLARGEYYYHQFTKEQPDLNFENEDVIVEIENVYKFWIEKGVDGFRVDAVPHIHEDLAFEDEPPNPNPGDAHCQPLRDYPCLIHNSTYNIPANFPTLARFRKFLDDNTPPGKDLVMMVESTVSPLEKLMEYYGTEAAPIAHYPFNIEFINRINMNSKGSDIAGLVDEWFSKMPESNTANWLLGNHDNHRVATRFGREKADSLNMINLLLPGTAVTYYGEEIGMEDADISWEDTLDPPACDAGEERYKEFSRDPERTPMQWNGREKNAGFSEADKTWLPMHPDWMSVNVENQTNAEGLTHIKVYKKIVEMRKTDAWRFGSMRSLAIENGDLFGFTRIWNDTSVVPARAEGFIVLTNFGTTIKLTNLRRQFGDVVPPLATVHVTSVGYLPETEIGSEKRTDSLAIYPNHGIILKWNIS